jgi:hypothetical protein
MHTSQRAQERVSDEFDKNKLYGLSAMTETRSQWRIVPGKQESKPIGKDTGGNVRLLHPIK